MHRLCLLATCFLLTIAGAARGKEWPIPWLGLHLLVDNASQAESLKKQIPVLAKTGVNVLIIEVDYNFEYTSHPELSSDDHITKKQAHEIGDLCRANGIRVIPQINCLGHQSWANKTGALLAKHPELDETPGQYPENKGIYCRSWCPSNPQTNQIVLPLFDELIDAFGADAVHVGMDEIFIMASEYCNRCRGKDPADLFAAQVNSFHKHFVDEKHVEMFMWADRLLDSKSLGYSKWEASANGTWPAVDRVPKDIVMCDWHYEKQNEYKSIPYLAAKGFRVWPAGWKNPDATTLLLDQADKSNPTGKMMGYLSTTWYALPIEKLPTFPPTLAAAQRLHRSK